MSEIWSEDVYPKSIYIHWPFCKNKCRYCDFVSFAGHEGFEKKYHDALLREIILFSKSLTNKKSEKTFNVNEKIKSIFIGGGTPSLYPLNLLEELVRTLKIHFPFDELEEFTIEGNPRDITENMLRVWSDLGINRLSMGVQVLDDNALKKLNRFQNKKDVFKVMEIAPKYFSNISVDLILGLPGVSKQKWMETLNQVVSWPLKHISVYFLTVYEKTPLYFDVKSGLINLIKENEQLSLYKRTVEILKQNGFEQYETSNFAKHGFESIHNVAYWDRLPYRGFGLSASSFDGVNRFTNIKKLSDYLKNVEKNDKSSDPYFFEKLTLDQVVLETVMLGLRQRKGLDLHRVLYLLKRFQKVEFLHNIKSLESRGLISVKEGKLVLTFKGILLENEIVLRLLDF